MVVASVPPPPSEETVKSAPTAPAPAAVTGAAEFHDRGRKLIQEEKFAASIEPLTQAVKLDPFLSQAFNARGYAYYRLRRFKQAVADFDEAIKLNPMYTNAYVNRGAARRAAGDVHGADIDQTKARQLMKMATQ
jgi:Flp pilus assembly protein TadD